MPPKQEIVITGLGVVSPIGIGKEAFWAALREGRSGIRTVDLPEDPDLAPPIGGAVADFDPKQYVRPRKSLKVMSRDIQLGFAAADLACLDAGLREKPIDPERLGVVFGAGMISCELDELAGTYRGCTVDGVFDFRRWGTVAMAELFPLWMLKYLPNMPACHIGIGQDARGPNNSITLGEVSSLSALAEAVRIVERSQADVIIAGGVDGGFIRAMGAKPGPRHVARCRDPAAAPRPFDSQRDGRSTAKGRPRSLSKRGPRPRPRRDAACPHPRLSARPSRRPTQATPRPRRFAGRSPPPCATPVRRRKSAVLSPTRSGAVEGDRIEAQAIRDDARRRAGHRAEELFRPSRRRRRCAGDRRGHSLDSARARARRRSTTSSPTRSARSTSSAASPPR